MKYLTGKATEQLTLKELKAVAGCLGHAQKGHSFSLIFPDFKGFLKILMKPSNVDSLPTAAKNKRCPFQKRTQPSP